MRLHPRLLVLALLTIAGLLACVRPSSALPNYQPAGLVGWPAPLYLCETSPASMNYSGIVEVLYGDSTSIYPVGCMANRGTAGAAPVGFGIYVDSVLTGFSGTATLGPNFFFPTVAPVPARGGLHTFILKCDSQNADLESDENDNYYGLQASVVPTEFLAAGSSRPFPQPPNPTAGIGLITPPFYANKDGIRCGWLPPARGRWSAIAVHAANGSNYDIGLYEPATGQGSGFRTAMATSVHPGAATEIILRNNGGIADHDHDLGVVYASGSGSYIAESRMAPDNIPMAINTVVNGSLTGNQMVAVDEYVHVPVPTVSWIRLRLETTPGIKLHMAAVSPTLGVCSRNALTDTAGTNAQGVAVLDLSVPVTGGAQNYAVIVYRDLDDGGSSPLAYTLRLISAPNYTNEAFPGWIGTIGVANGTPNLTSEPATLAGTPTATSVMFGFRNNGSMSATGGSYRLYLDGVVAVDKSGLTLAPDEITTVSPAFPLIAGGRHTLSYALDYAGAVAEWNESDNAWGKQWTWTPTLQGGSAASRIAPDAQGGWTHLPAGVTPLPNLDGVRATFTPNSSSYWGATLMTPNAGNTNSLTYYSPGSGPFGAFVTPVLGVSKPAGRTSAILADVPVATSYDVGVQRLTGTGGYTIQNLTPVDLGALPITSATQTINSGQIGKLYSFKTINFLPITLQVLLQNLSGNADLALAVYQHAVGGYGVRDAETTTFADANGAGGNEEAVRPIQQDLTQVAILVYKTNAADLGKSVSFALRTSGGAVAGVEDAPRAVAFALAGENPSRSGAASLHFDLPAAAEASLEVFDVTGQRVRTLAEGRREPGSYTLDWDGRDDGGRALSNGVYFARFRAPGFARTIRVSLLK
ncbi:MAG: FlgD immunoglobulin-like domain containing protein [Candidatus Eisenbacteria bacterium]